MPRSSKVQEAEASAQVVETQIMNSEQSFELAHRELLVGLPDDAPSLRRLSLTCQQQSADAMYEHGRVLIALKQVLDHGQFAQHLVEELGIQPRWAQSLMRFALDCNQLAVITKGRLDFDAVKRLGPSKAMLFARAALEAPEESTEEGTVAGASLDEYDAMTVREMRDRLRRKDKQLEDGRQQLSDAREKIGTLTDHLKDLREASKENVLACCNRLRKDVNEAAQQFLNTLPKEQKLGPLQVTALRELTTFNLAIANQLNSYILEKYPAAEIATANAEGRADLPQVEANGVDNLPADYPTVHTIGTATSGEEDHTADLFSGLRDKDTVHGFGVTFAQWKEIASCLVDNVDADEASVARQLDPSGKLGEAFVNRVRHVLNSEEMADFLSGNQTIPVQPVPASKSAKSAKADRRGAGNGKASA